MACENNMENDCRNHKNQLFIIGRIVAAILHE